LDTSSRPASDPAPGSEAPASPPQRFARLALTLVLALWAIEACDFSPRDPENPGGGQVPLVTLSDPDSALVQIQRGLAVRLTSHYMNAFDDPFVFHPDERDSIELSTENPGVFDDWDRQVEEEVTNIIITSSAQIAVSFTTAESTVVEAGRVVVVNEDYELTVDADEYEGQAEFTIVNTNGEWRIFSWLDRRRSGSSLSSWGFLKGENRPGF
jgi:hypothetical protein